MRSGKSGNNREDPFDLQRFLKAQERIYDQALSELKTGEKRSHWMWYIFPQIDGLGFSSTTKHYSIKSMEEARAYLDHPVLGKRLIECTETVLAISGKSVSRIFGYPDDLKFKSSMTLFAEVTGSDSSFGRAIEQFYNGRRDEKTLALLRKGL